MNECVPYPPMQQGEYSEIETHAWGMIPVRIVVSRRVEGWCAYLLLKYMPAEYAALYGSPTRWENVRGNGDKMPEQYARELFPEMEGYYVP